MDALDPERLMCAAYRSQLEDIFRTARQSFARAETPEQFASENELADRQWTALTEMVWDLLKEALYDKSPAARSRTEMIEDAIELMVAKIQEYPSSPYTKDSVESLGNMLNALDVSMKIDRKSDEEPDEP